MRVVSFVLAAVALSATFIPMLRIRSWWVRVFDFPRVQVAVLALMSLALWAHFRGVRDSWSISVEVALAFCLFYQGALMLPYTRVWRRQVKAASSPSSQRDISLVLANVLMTNRNAEDFLRIIRTVEADIVLAVEADHWWAERLGVLAQDYPYRLQCPLENTYGMVLFSKLELRDPQVRYLVEEDIPSIHSRCVLPSGDEVELHFLHPRPPFPTENDRSTERDAELLIVGKQIKDSRLPQIVAGDLNDVAWSRTTKLFQRISGLLDPRVGRGFYNTFHAMHPLLRFSLDHLFHSSDFRFRDMRVLPCFGSDHFPVYVSLSYEPIAASDQPEPEPDTEDVSEAHETIREAETDSAPTR